jgi:uncharacterized protein
MNDFITIIKQNKYLFDVLKIAGSDQTEKFYVGAGAVTQTVWNSIFGNEPTYGIDDIDIVYFNNDDVSELAEDAVITTLSQKLKHIPFRLDIKNQARVHLWYKDKFGIGILPISSIEDAIDRWPTTSNSIGLRMDRNNNMEIYAPFGLDDLFSGIVRPNKREITEEIYNRKVQKWIKKWPDLKVIPWS